MLSGEAIAQAPKAFYFMPKRYKRGLLQEPEVDALVVDARSDETAFLQENANSLQISAADNQGDPDRAEDLLLIGQLQAEVADEERLRREYVRALAAKDKEIAEVEAIIANNKKALAEQQAEIDRDKQALADKRRENEHLKAELAADDAKRQK